MADFFRRLRVRWKTFLAGEREKTKNMTRKQKWEYFISYYWLETFGILLAVGTITFLIFMGVNLSKTNIFYLGVVDSDFTKAEYKAFAEDFMAFTGDTNKKHRVTVDYGISSLGASKDPSDAVYEFQEKSTVLVGTALLDAYFCTEEYIEFLQSYEDICPISELLGDETEALCGDRLCMDGYAIRLGGTKAESSGAVSYDPAYLVFTWNWENHFPEAAKAFAHYILEP